MNRRKANKTRPSRTFGSVTLIKPERGGAFRMGANNPQTIVGGFAYTPTTTEPPVQTPNKPWESCQHEQLPNIDDGVLFGLGSDDPRTDTEHPELDFVWDDKRGVWERFAAKQKTNAQVSGQHWVLARLGSNRVLVNPRSGKIRVVASDPRTESNHVDPKLFGGNTAIKLRTNSLPQPIPYTDPRREVWEKFAIRTNDELQEFLKDSLNTATVWDIAYWTAVRYLYGKRLARSVDGRLNGDAEQLANDTLSTLFGGVFSETRRSPSVRTLKRGVKYRKLGSGSIRPTTAVQNTNGQWMVPNMVWVPEQKSYMLPTFAEQHPNGVPIGAVVRMTVYRTISEKARWYEDPNKDQPLVCEPEHNPTAPTRNLVRALSGHPMLTDTESTVWNLIGRGLSVAEIARSLDVRPTTLYSMLDRNKDKYRTIFA